MLPRGELFRGYEKPLLRATAAAKLKPMTVGRFWVSAAKPMLSLVGRACWANVHEPRARTPSMRPSSLVAKYVPRVEGQRLRWGRAGNAQPLSIPPSKLGQGLQELSTTRSDSCAEDCAQRLAALTLACSAKLATVPRSPDRKSTRLNSSH